MGLRISPADEVENKVIQEHTVQLDLNNLGLDCVKI